MFKSLIAVFSLLLLAGCAGTDRRPIVDMQGVNVAQYNNDLVECQNYAADVEAGRQVVQGAAGGAVVGAVVGAAVGNSDTAQRAAGAGAAAGATRGAVNAARERDQVLRNCLRGRGYRVLN
jgi:outer membrane lipoprotein SlyB